MYQDIVAYIRNGSDLYPFEMMSENLIRQIDSGSKQEFLRLLIDIGTIPECIAPSSTEEKLFSKASDAALSRAFREIGLNSAVLRERGDSADVIAKSPLYGYALVADAKAFRLSRTAKNQKDFKVAALSRWRGTANYAVLCAPYFQYPSKSSQIYAQSLDYQVVLASWEHLIFLIERNVREGPELNFSRLWNFPSYAYPHSDRKQCLLSYFDREVETLAGAEARSFSKELGNSVMRMILRADREISFLSDERRKIEAYSREEAIRELISSKKIYPKISQIIRLKKELLGE